MVVGPDGAKMNGVGSVIINPGFDDLENGDPNTDKPP